MATNSEKFAAMLQDVAGGNENTLEKLANKAVESGVSHLNSMSDEQYLETVQNFAAGPLRDAVKSAFSKIDPDKDEEAWKYVTGVSQRAAKYEKKNFDRDQATLEKFYGDKYAALMDGDESELKYQAAAQGTSPEVLKAELDKAKKYADERKESEDKAKADIKEYRTGLKGSLISENAKNDFEQGNTVKGVVSDILAKGATAADFASGAMGPTPWGYFASAIGPSMRAINNHVLHDTDKSNFDVFKEIGEDYLGSAVTQAIPGAKIYGGFKSGIEHFIPKIGDIKFLNDVEKLVKNEAGSVKSAISSLNKAKKAEKEAEAVRKAAWKKNSGATFAEKAVTKENKAAATEAVKAAEQQVKEATKAEARQTAFKKFGGTSKGASKAAKVVPAVGRGSLRYNLTDAAPSSKSDYEKQAEKFSVDPVTIRMWNAGFKPNAGQELDLYKQWENYYKRK